MEAYTKTYLGFTITAVPYALDELREIREKLDKRSSKFYELCREAQGKDAMAHIALRSDFAWAADFRKRIDRELDLVSLIFGAEEWSIVDHGNYIYIAREGYEVYPATWDEETKSYRTTYGAVSITK